MSQMSEYEFTLTFSLPEAEGQPEQYLDALYEAGCDDALIGIGQTGSIALEFVREADSANAAIGSAVENVKTAIPDAELIEAKPDLVGLSDVAQILNCTRQNVRKYMKSHLDFPKPIHTGKTSLWHLFDLAIFHKFDVPTAIVEISKMTYKINLDIQQQHYRKIIEDNSHEQRLAM
jgi:predicted DNA-binding transcriptional regulator AlpA